MARRGPLHAQFTIKELRELANLGRPCGAGQANDPNTWVDLVAPIEECAAAEQKAAALGRPRQRLMQLLHSVAQRHPGWSLEVHRLAVSVQLLDPTPKGLGACHPWVSKRPIRPARTFGLFFFCLFVWQKLRKPLLLLALKTHPGFSNES